MTEHGLYRGLSAGALASCGRGGVTKERVEEPTHAQRSQLRRARHSSAPSGWCETLSGPVSGEAASQRALQA